MEFNTKLKKYKGKYLTMKQQLGGIIGKIPLNKLDEVITYDDLPEEVQNYIKIITIPETHIIPVGSGTLRIQRFPSDVDVMNIVEKPISTDNIILLFIENIKNMVKTIRNSDKVMFSDFKAGHLHWTVDQILNERNGNLSLIDACKILDVVKIDMFAPHNRRYVEMSTFFILKSIDGFVNVDKNYFSNFQQSLFDDIQHYKDEKPFKAIKRWFSLSKITNDVEAMDKIEYLINSNISLLAQITADLETLKLMLEKKSKYNKPFVIDEIENFKERLSHILDIEFDEKQIINMIDNMSISYKYDSDERQDNLTKLHDYLLYIINRETVNYMKSINLEFPNTFNKSNASENSIFNHNTLVLSLEKSKNPNNFDKDSSSNIVNKVSTIMMTAAQSKSIPQVQSNPMPQVHKSVNTLSEEDFKKSKKLVTELSNIMLKPHDNKNNSVITRSELLIGN